MLRWLLPRTAIANISLSLSIVLYLFFPGLPNLTLQFLLTLDELLSTCVRELLLV